MPHKNKNELCVEVIATDNLKPFIQVEAQTELTL